MMRMILDDASKFVIPLMFVLIPLYGMFKRVAVYEEFITGAKEGFSVAVRIIPYLVAILFAIGMFRASGAMEWMITGLRPVAFWMWRLSERRSLSLITASSMRSAWPDVEIVDSTTPRSSASSLPSSASTNPCVINSGSISMAPLVGLSATIGITSPS